MIGREMTLTQKRQKRKKRSKAQMERTMLQICSENINMYVPWYIMAAYAYYVDDDPILEDYTFDKMATKILNHYDEIEHIHKHLLTKDALTAGTYLGEYPSRIKGALDEVRHIADVVS
jgi:NAD-dependent DNA ligase